MTQALKLLVELCIITHLYTVRDITGAVGYVNFYFANYEHVIK
jgi:hypothetical protein